MDATVLRVVRAIRSGRRDSLAVEVLFATAAWSAAAVDGIDLDGATRQLVAALARYAAADARLRQLDAYQPDDSTTRTTTEGAHDRSDC